MRSIGTIFFSFSLANEIISFGYQVTNAFGVDYFL